MGIEPTLSAWEAEVLPLNYTRFNERYSKLNLFQVNLKHLNKMNDFLSLSECATLLLTLRQIKSPAMQTFLFYDIETTGLNKSFDQHLKKV